MVSPRQLFEDNIRPADLLLKVFRLLEHDAPNAEADPSNDAARSVTDDMNDAVGALFDAARVAPRS